MAKEGVFKRVLNPDEFLCKSRPGDNVQLPVPRETSLDKLLSAKGNPVQDEKGNHIENWSPDLQLLLTSRMREMMDILGRAPLREEALIDLAKRAHPEYDPDQLLEYTKRDPQSCEMTLRKLLRVDAFRAQKVEEAVKEAAEPPRQPKPVRKVITKIAQRKQEPTPEPTPEPEPLAQPAYAPPPIRRSPAIIIGPTGLMRVQVTDVIYTDKMVILIQETDNDISFWEPPMDETISWRISYDDSVADCVYSGISYDVDRHGETHFIFLILE